MPSHRPQRITKPSARSGNTSGPGQHLTRSTRPPRGGAIVPETKPPANTQGSEGTLRGDVIDVHRTPEPTPDLLLDLRAQQEATATALRQEETRHLQKQIADNLAAIQRIREGNTVPEYRHEAHTPHPNQLLPAETEGTDPCLLPLIIEYPAINSIYFRQILSNKFDPINISKLCTDVVLIKPTVKRVNLAKGYELI